MKVDIAAAGADIRRRFTGTVLVDVSGHVDGWGRLTRDGQMALSGGLIDGRGLSVRLVIGDLRDASTATASEALIFAYLCRSVDVCGADPGCVADIVTWLRTHELTASEADYLTYFLPDPEGDE